MIPDDHANNIYQEGFEHVQILFYTLIKITTKEPDSFPRFLQLVKRIDQRQDMFALITSQVLFYWNWYLVIRKNEKRGILQLFYRKK